MSRTEYMRELDALLQGISKEEREEAMQYYNDYFDDAGSENEEKVIEELGSPAKLAETIRAGINGNTDEAESYGEYGERGYQDRRFDSSEYPAGRDDYYKDSYSETCGESQSQNDRNPFSERQYSYTANSNQGYTYAGNGMLGVGCLLLALGAVFTVLIGWGCIKLIPMMFRGLVNLCRRPFQKKRGECR